METTLCYIEKDEKYLMLYRNKKKNDFNQGKWVGIGGKLEKGESPEECVAREVMEETGLSITSFKRRGIVHFRSDVFDEEMYLFTATTTEGELLPECNEGDLKWIPKDEILSLPLWEGDRYFLDELKKDKTGIEMTLTYVGDRLVEVTYNDNQKR